MKEMTKAHNLDRDKTSKSLLLQLAEGKLSGPACSGAQGGVCIDVRKKKCAESPISGKCAGDKYQKCCVSGRSKGNAGNGLTASTSKRDQLMNHMMRKKMKSARINLPM